MTDTNKISAKPISVSHSEPVYIDGKIKYYQVTTVFAGDLRLVPPAITHDDLIRNPALYKETLLYEMMRPVLNPNIQLPRMLHIYSLKYNATDNTTSVVYAFRNTVFGGGAKRAWKFRLYMLGEISRSQKENVK